MSATSRTESIREATPSLLAKRRSRVLRIHRSIPVLLVIAGSCLLAACAPTPAPPIQTSDYGCAVAANIRQVWQRDADWAIHIAMRESGCDEKAYNRSGASGIFQMMMPLHADLLNAVCLDGDAFLADCNIRAAWLLYEGAGRSPWNG